MLQYLSNTTTFFMENFVICIMDAMLNYKDFDMVFNVEFSPLFISDCYFLLKKHCSCPEESV